MNYILEWYLRLNVLIIFIILIILINYILILIHGEWLEALTSKQILHRLPVVLAQGKAGNTSENLLHETRKIIYSLHQTKEITKKVYNNIIDSREL